MSPQVVRIAEALGLTCPDCGGQLEDRIGPFFCPACERFVSAWTLFFGAVGRQS
jgi:uncharacterized Zn finger protein (UPF0148 family)